FIASSALILGLIGEMAAAEALQLPGSRSAFYRQAIEHMWSSKLPNRTLTTEVNADHGLQLLASIIGLERLQVTRHEVVHAMQHAGLTDEACDRLCEQIVRAGLLRQTFSASAGEHYEFVHLTFQEFYL